MMKAGLYSDIPFADYLAIDAVSNTYLGHLADCPAAAKIPMEDTASLLFGRAVHKYVLEGPEAFGQSFVIAPEINKRTNAGKEEWAAFLNANVGKDIITREDAEEVAKIHEAVHTHPFASMLLDGISTEQTIIWRDEEHDLPCKGRIDVLPDPQKRCLIDLKTTKDAGDKAFSRSVVTYGYDRQAAMYLDGINNVQDARIDSFIFICVETEAPYRVEVYLLDDEFVHRGREEYRRLMKIEKECRAKNFWPHYTNPELTPIFRPSWA